MSVNRETRPACYQHVTEVRGASAGAGLCRCPPWRAPSGTCSPAPGDGSWGLVKQFILLEIHVQLMPPSWSGAVAGLHPVCTECVGVTASAELGGSGARRRVHVEKQRWPGWQWTWSLQRKTHLTKAGLERACHGEESVWKAVPRAPDVWKWMIAAV